MSQAPPYRVGVSLPWRSVGVCDNTALWGALADTILNVNQKRRAHRCTSGASVQFYLFTEGYFQYTIVQIYFVEFLYSEEKGTFRLMKWKKLKIMIISHFLLLISCIHSFTNEKCLGSLLFYYLFQADFNYFQSESCSLTADLIFNWILWHLLLNEKGFLSSFVFSGLLMMVTCTAKTVMVWNVSLPRRQTNSWLLWLDYTSQNSLSCFCHM